MAATWMWEFDMEEWHEGAVAKTLISDMGGREKRGKKGTPYRTFRGKLKRFSRDIGDVVSFFIARHGEYEAFTIIHPRTGESILVRFDEDNIDSSQFYYIVAEIGVRLREVI